MKSTSKQRRTLAWAALAVGTLITMVVVVQSLRVYGFRPTPGIVFVLTGWFSLVAFGVLITRAFMHLNLAREADGVELDDAELAVEDLQREKKLLLKAIHEIEFDQSMGKIDDADAKRAIDTYRARAIEVLKVLDAEGNARYHQVINEEVKRRVAKAGTRSPGLGSGAVSAACKSCKTENDGDATFCKKCGARLGRD